MNDSMNNENQALVPRLRFPKFREAGEWEEKRLGTQGDFLSSLTGKSAKDFDTGDAKFIPYMNVFSNSFTDVRDLRAVNVTEGESQNAVVQGDVFFTVSSETPEEAGMSSVLLEEIKNCYLNSFCALFRFDDHRPPNLVFLGYFLRSELVRGHLSRGAQGATRYNISKAVFRELPLLLPLPPEQQKIADCLSSLDALIVAQADKLDALKTHKKGLMQQLFPREGETIPRLRFPEFRDAGEWIEKTLEQVAEYKNGKAHEQDIDDQGRYVVVNSKFISTEGEVTKFSNAANLLAKKDDILMVLSDVPNGRAIAKCFYVDKDDNYTVNQRICKLTAKKNTVSIMLFYILDRNAYFLAFDDGVKQTNLKKDDVLNCPVLLPDDKAEQQKIADCLSSLDTLIAAQEDKLYALKTHKKGLMQQLFPSPEA